MSLLKKPIILFSKSDYKFKMWSQALKSQGVESFAPKSGRLIFGFPRLLKRGHDRAVVFRYLNDRKSFLHSLFFLISDFLTCILSWLFGIERIWILHNIDKESSANYNSIVLLRRSLISNCVSKILVTDPLLIKSAKALMPQHEKKIDCLSFGRYQVGLIKKNQISIEESFDKGNNNYLLNDFHQMLELLANEREKYDFVGFCGGKFSKKRTNFYEIPNLIRAAKQNNVKLMLLVISNMNSSDDVELYDFIKNSSNVMFFNCLIELDEFELSRFIDFYWSGYSDISIPYTLYTAATVGRPIVSVNTGMLPQIVNEYKLGMVMDSDFQNIKECLIKTKDDTAFEFDKFLKTHSWQNGASQILRAAFPKITRN